MAIFRRNRKDDVTRKTTGTSYTAKGDVKLKAADYNEKGTSRSSVARDPVPALLTDRQKSATYSSMARSDVSVRIGLRAGEAPVLGADYFMEPCGDTPEDLAIAEFVEYNLFEGMTIPFLKTMEQILKFYRNPRGNSIFEKVWEEREWAPRVSAPGANRRRYTMLRKLAYRPAETIKEIQYDDNGGPEGIIQNFIGKDGNTSEKEISIDKLAIFVYDPDSTGVEGTPILRSAYRNWFYKDRFYAIDGVQKERHGIGVPDIELQPGHDNEDIELAHQLGRNLRTNENAYIVRNTKMKVGFAELSGQLVNALDSAMHHDTMILKNIMVQFLNAGLDSSGGGRATSATAMDMFLKSMRYVAGSICDVINMYVIPQLVVYNFKTDKFPKLNVRSVGETKDLQMWAAAMANLIKAEAITVDTETENWLRKNVDMPTLKGERPAQKQQDAPFGGSNGKADGFIREGNIGKSASSGAV